MELNTLVCENCENLAEWGYNHCKSCYWKRWHAEIGDGLRKEPRPHYKEDATDRIFAAVETEWWNGNLNQHQHRIFRWAVRKSRAVA